MKHIFYKLLSFLIRKTPVFILYFYAFIISRLAFIFWKRRKNIAYNNLKMIYPNKDEKFYFEFIKKNFYENGKTFFEIFKQPDFAKFKHRIEVIGKENLDKAYKKEKGVILFTLHHGNWEFTGSMTALLGYPIAVVQKNQKNKEFDQLLNSFREKNGMKIIGRKSALKEGVKELKNGNILTIVGDQKAFTSGITVPFMGFGAKTSPLAAKLHIKYKSPIIFMTCVRTGFFKFKLEYSSEYNYNTENVEKITTDLNKISEEIIKKHPHQWFWGHRRWE
ncbi:MAG: lysophospholipid acyltransferase family protein [Candidatus Muirbacterium halophilum]|nr:lysophospholipid acyltransferase family protein [Candidatus Muirbacterium halophilum]MCK9474645.1 lysophospholipid acyltransferase family protein [Candidatus Muirbacterium halophilum]